MSYSYYNSDYCYGPPSYLNDGHMDLRMTTAKVLCERRKRLQRKIVQELVEKPVRKKLKKDRKEKIHEGSGLAEPFHALESDKLKKMKKKNKDICEGDEEIKAHQKKEKKKKKVQIGHTEHMEDTLSVDISDTSSKKKSKKERKIKVKLTQDNDDEPDVGMNESHEENASLSKKLNKKRKHDDIENGDEKSEDKKRKKIEKECMLNKEHAEVEKSKKMKMKKKKDASDTEDSQPASELAIKYLHSWTKDRKKWRFQKVRQVWLLQNMYSNVISDEDFNELLEYLEGMKGLSRQKTVEQAEKVMKNAENTEDEEADKSAISSISVERARQVLQMLT